MLKKLHSAGKEPVLKNTGFEKKAELISYMKGIQSVPIVNKSNFMRVLQSLIFLGKMLKFLCNAQSYSF